MSGSEGGDKFDHVVSVMFENRSFDNLLGYLYEPGEVESFEGVAGREFSNPIPEYAPGSERGSVPVHPAENMNTPDPDPGEEYQHVNTQLFGTVIPPENRSTLAEAMEAPRTSRTLPRADEFARQIGVITRPNGAGGDSMSDARRPWGVLVGA